MGFNFKFLLSTLEHLGRGLYRSFATVIAEAISNAWDADAKSVHIEIKKDSLMIWDDGDGMSRSDFQKKFLRIGYTRRNTSEFSDSGKRRILGRKGIGKLSYLSISEKVTVITKQKNKKKFAVIMDNQGIDKAIDKNKDAQQYKIPEVNASVLSKKDYKIEESGTRLVFSGLRKHLRKGKSNIATILATQFHFSHVLKRGDEFEIFVNGEKVGMKDLANVYDNGEFIWFFDEKSKDQFYAELESNGIIHKFENPDTILFPKMKSKAPGLANARGYIISVKKPRHLFIDAVNKEFKASVVLFANGRMRELNLMAKVSNAQLPENYLFGEIHIDSMDKGEADCFTSARDGLKEDSPTYDKFIASLREILTKITADWNKWRTKSGKPTDSEKRTVEKLVDELFLLLISKEKKKKLLPAKRFPDHPLTTEIKEMARKNVPSYVKSFMVENLMRHYIATNKIPYRDMNGVVANIDTHQVGEGKAKKAANIPKSTNIRHCVWGKNKKGINYLSFIDLAHIIDRHKNLGPNIHIKRDAADQKPIRDAVMHTALLTDDAEDLGEQRWKNVIHKLLAWMDGKEIT